MNMVRLSYINLREVSKVDTNIIVLSKTKEIVDIMLVFKI